MTKEEKARLLDELSKEAVLEIPPERIVAQIETFERGIPFVKLAEPCIVGKGIKVISSERHEHLIDLFRKALTDDRIIKFVPASGAASRMFKRLQTVLLDLKITSLDELRRNKSNKDCLAVLEFIENIKRFAFFDELRDCLHSNGNHIDDLLKDGNVADILRYTLEAEGLNYSNLPKGCIKFHSYPDGSRTAFEEHLIEASEYSVGRNGGAKIHFTISPEHQQVVHRLMESLIKKYEEMGKKFDLSFSVQSPSANTIAVTPDNKPFRDNEGNIVFRPGGHGALLKNLNELKGDIVMIKNIDNVVQDYLKGETYKFKKILGGYLVELQSKIFSFLVKLESGVQDQTLIDDITTLISSELEMEMKPGFNLISNEEQRKYLFEFLNRPIRVCGMVKNTGEPGGGPFRIKDEQGIISKQVVETTQIDLNDPEQKRIFESATHFSPTDFVCGLRDYKGNNFNLFDFVNPGTGLITKKSFNGRELKALELPGLWNGGMYYWISVFVEVPDITFNPVKEINDLLKKEHQPTEV